MFATKRRLICQAGLPVHDDLIKRDFTAAAANQLWLTAITEHRTDAEKLYLCAIKCVHSNRIVGYSIDSRMEGSLVMAAPCNAVSLRSPLGTVVDSDCGSHFVPTTSSGD